MPGTHDQNVFPDRYARASVGVRGPARKCTTPTQGGKGRREVSSIHRAGGHKGTKTREVSKKTKMLRAQGPAHSLLGKDRPGKRKETDERGHPVRQGGIPGIPGRGSLKA